MVNQENSNDKKKEVKVAKITKQQTRYDPETKRFIVLPPKGKIPFDRFSIDKELIHKLTEFAIEDGIDLTGKTEKGSTVRTTLVIKSYIEAAIREFINERNKLSQ